MSAVENAKAFLDECKFYYLATCEGDQPRVRPFGAHVIFEGRLYLQTGKVKAVAKQLEANPKVELCGCTGPAWVRITGKLVEDPRIEAQQALLDAFPMLKNMYAAGDGNTAVYYFDEAEAAYYSFTGEPKVEKL